MSVLEKESIDAASIVPAPVLDSQSVQEGKGFYNFCRRTRDIICSIIALSVLWPLMLITAIAIVIDSPGASPIFTQERVGKGGKRFKFYKFRSMCADAEAKLESLMELNEMDGPAFKIKDDPRITRVGKFIRACSIDELPQLINILKGDMSIVGPRPPLPREVEQYTEYDNQRLLVTPGLTCYWQIKANRNDISFSDWVALDVKYIQERSSLTDWKIIFMTVGAVLGMNGE